VFDLLTNLEQESENKINNSAKNEYLSTEKEIECPRCHGIMTLHREFDLSRLFLRGVSFCTSYGSLLTVIRGTLIVENDLKEILLGLNKTNLTEKQPLMHKFPELILCH
jgi:hypothetical protein